MVKTLHGIAHGKMIELDEDLGVAEGQPLEVHIRVIQSSKKLPGPPAGWHPGGTESAAGRMAQSWTEEDDRIFNEIYQDRKISKRMEIQE